MQKGIISFQTHKLHFADLHGLRIQTGGRVWVFELETAEELKFKPEPDGGYAGAGNWLKYWRKRKPKPKPNGKLTHWSQADAAEEFGLTQSHWALMEKGKRHIPLRILKRVEEENRQAYLEETKVPEKLKQEVLNEWFARLKKRRGEESSD